MTRPERISMWQSFLSRLDKRYVGKVYKALRNQYSSFTDELKRNGIEAARAKLRSEFLNEEIAPVILEIHEEAGVFMANKTLSALRKEKVKLKYRGFGFNEEWARDIKDYFRVYLLNKSVFPISETTRNRILEVLEKAIDEGWGVDEIVAKINDLEQIRGRARMIVRTETTRAANYGTFLGAEKFDYEVEKEWIAVDDNRTRRTHSHAFGVDGQLRDIDQRFSNGLLFPGDPSGPAKEVVNCRCALGWKAKRDERGRMIPKKSPTVRVSRTGNLIDILGGVTAGIMIGNLLNDIEDVR